MPGGKEPVQGQGQQGGTLPPGPPPDGAGGGAAAGNGAPTGGNATGKGGTRPKDTKGPPPPVIPQVLQLTPELFQQTVAAAVTAALAAAQPAQAQALQAATVPTPVLPRKEKKLTEFWSSRPVMWFRLFDCQFPETLSEHCLLYTSPSPRDLSTSRMPSSA